MSVLRTLLLAIAAGCGEQAPPIAASTPAPAPAAPAPAAPAPTAPAPSPAVSATVPAAPAAPAGAPPAVSAAAPSDEVPPLQIEPPLLDFGIMAPRAGGKGSVRLTNTGSVPLTIAAVTPSCKCTTTSALAGKVLAPGASETLEAALDGASMPQTHRASIKVAIEGYSRVAEIQLRGETSMPVRAVPAIINAVEGKPRSGRFLVESIDRQPFRICSVGGREPEFIGFSAGEAPRAQYLLRFDLDAWGADMPAYLAIETDRADCPVFDVWIRTERTIPKSVFRMKDYRLNVGRLDLGQSKELRFEMDDSGEEVLAVLAESPEVQLELTGQEARDGTRTVRALLTPKSPRTGLLYTVVKLYGREREQPVTVFGSIRAPGATGCDGCNPLPAPAATPGRPAAEPALQDLSAPARR